MELGWKEGLRTIRQNLGENNAKAFDFYKDQEVHYVVNHLNYKTFPRLGHWDSPNVRWSRAGLGVFDFLLDSTKQEKPQEDAIVILVKTVDDVTISMTCRVMEAHMQTKQELGSFYEGRVSTVCGRAVLSLVDFSVTSSS